MCQPAKVCASDRTPPILTQARSQRLITFPSPSSGAYHSLRTPYCSPKKGCPGVTPPSLGAIFSNRCFDVTFAGTSVTIPPFNFRERKRPISALLLISRFLRWTTIVRPSANLRSNGSAFIISFRTGYHIFLESIARRKFLLKEPSHTSQRLKKCVQVKPEENGVVVFIHHLFNEVMGFPELVVCFGKRAFICFFHSPSPFIPWPGWATTGAMDSGHAVRWGAVPAYESRRCWSCCRWDCVPRSPGSS